MRRSLVILVALAVLGTGVVAAPTAAAAPGKKPHCKKGQVAKRKHGKWVCVQAPKKFTPHPGLDVLQPGTYKGSRGVTLTSSVSAEGATQITITIVFPQGYVSCQGRPPYPSLTITVPDMAVLGYGDFSGTASKGGAYMKIDGHFTSPNTLVLDSAGASNVMVKGERCAAQYTNTSIAF